MEKARFQDLIDKLSSVATLDRWQPTYDRQLDFFYWKKQPLSKGARLVKMSHETHLYLTPAGKIEGVLVEYLNGNFVEHNSDYRGMIRSFDKKVGRHEYTISKKSRKMEILFDKFAESLKADIYRDACEDRRTVDDLNFVIKEALTKRKSR